MSLTATQLGLSLFPMIVDAVKNHSGKEKSLIQATKGARFEPIALVDTDCAYYENISDVMQSCTSIFTGYLLQAIALHGVVDNVKVLKNLEKFNPDRDPNYADLARFTATESFKDRLPTPKGSLALESLDTNAKVRMSPTRRSALEALSINKDLNDEIRQSVNLSVGKIFSVDFGGKENKVSVPITIRLLSTLVASNRLSHILTQDALKLTSLKERYYAWKADRISFINDLIFCRDLIKQHRRELINDKDGVFSNIISRRSGNAVAGFTSGQPSLAAASNICIMSTETAESIETAIQGKLNNFAARQRVFEGTGLMLMVVIDKAFDRVIFYHEGISEETNLSMREIKTNNKGNGTDVTEILKAFSLGHGL